MKNYIYSALFFIGTVSFLSCSKITEQAPFTDISFKEAFNSPDRIEKSALGMYNALQNAEFLGGRALVYVDLRGNDVNVASFFANIPRFNPLSDNAIVQNCWTGAYRTIYQANVFIKNFNLYGKSLVSPTLSKQYIAEAKFIRSLCYFYLVNLYARPYVDGAGANLGVPLVLEAVTIDPLNAANKIPRSTVKQVYDQMIKDLTEAYPDLPNSYGTDYFDRARATQGAAQALLARIYLYKNDWDNAITMCDNVTAHGYTLEVDPYNNWKRSNYTTSANKERIFSVAMNTADNPNTNNAIGQHYSANGRGDITISDGYFNLPNFSTTDARQSTQFIRDVDGDSYVGKYYDNVYDSWVPIFRYAEILLIKAEALAQKNTATADPNAITLLRQIRARSGATALAPTTQAALLTNIWDERRIELAFEGHGEFDFLRTKRDIPARAGHLAQAWNSNFVIFPIPLIETQQNLNLVQNPGY